MAEMTLQHDRQCLAGPSGQSSQFNWGGHYFAHRSLFRIGSAECHLAQHIAFGEDASNPALAIDDCDCADMLVEHEPHSIGHASLNRNRRRFRITHFQDTHGRLPCTAAQARASSSSSSTRLGHYEPLGRRVKPLSCCYFDSLLKMLPSFMTNCTFSSTLMSRSGSPLSAMTSA